VNDEVSSILRAAVNIARNEQVRRLSTLRNRLAEMFPGKDAQINEALGTWADYARSSKKAA
jgi:hypothetical protein